MDCRDGRIVPADQLSAMPPDDRQYMREMAYHPTPIQRIGGRVGRNDPCGCGSRKKFKKCCLGKTAK